MELQIETFATLPQAVRLVGCDRATFQKRLADGRVQADALDAIGRPLFRITRIAQLNELIRRHPGDPEILA